MSEPDPFNCPKCGSHDFGLHAMVNGGQCIHCNRRDAERYRWLKPLLLLVDFNYKADEDKEEAVLIFELPDGLAVSANLDTTIDAALAADKPRFTDGRGNDITPLLDSPSKA